MPFRASYAVTGDIDIEVLGDGVSVRIPTGERVISISMSRHRARVACDRAVRRLNQADREQEAWVAEWRESERRH